MRKQTKKLLSWVLTGALLLGLGGNVNVNKVNADDEVTPKDITIEIDTNEYDVYGRDSDARLQIFNAMGVDTPDNVPALKAAGDYLYTGIKIDFTVANVKDALELAGTDKLTVLYNGADGQWGAGGAHSNEWNIETGVTIAEDGTYSATYDAGEDLFQIPSILLLKFKELDDDLIKDTNGGKNPLKYSDVSVTFLNAVEVPADDDTSSGDAIGSGDPVITPDDEPFYDEELWGTPGLHAYVSYQTNKWNFRDDYDPSKAATHSYSHATTAGDDSNLVAFDEYMTSDGEYTISMEGLDLYGDGKNWDGDPIALNWLAIATDIDRFEYEGVEITDFSVSIDDDEVEGPSGSLPYKEDQDYYFFSIANTNAAGGDAPWNDMLKNKQIPVPTESIEITFTITGLKDALQDLLDGNYVNPETGEKVDPDELGDYVEDIEEGIEESTGTGSGTGTGPTPTPTIPAGDNPTPTPTAPSGSNPTPTPTAPAGSNPTPTPTTAPVKKGDTTKDKVATYAVSNVNKKEVTVKSVPASTKKAKKITIPATVKINGVSYKVTAIGKNAFKGAKAKTIVLGKNITTIEKAAFANCKNLQSLKVNSKLKKVAKGAFKGCKKKIKVSGKSKKANVKLLKKSGYKKFK